LHDVPRRDAQTPLPSPRHSATSTYPTL
jgi:hypothetical protein